MTEPARVPDASPLGAVTGVRRRVEVRPDTALHVEPVGSDHFTVTDPGGSGTPHGVDFSGVTPTCDCPDFAYRGRTRPCKHIRAVEDHRLHSPDDPQAGLIDKISDDDLLDVLGPREPPSRRPVDRPLTELSLAEELVAQHGHDLRHVRAWRGWLEYDGRRWARDETGAVERLFKDLVRARITAAATVADDREHRVTVKQLLQFCTAHHVRSALELASTEPEVASTADVFDQDPWKLNVLNGTVDLRTGKLGLHTREDLITKVAPVAYDSDARCPRWERFLDEIFDGDTDLKEFVQRAVGYTLTGDVGEHVLLFLYGSGANGKTVAVETIQAVLGADYARTASFDSFLDRQRRAGAASPDLARLHGVRLVAASEAPAGRALNEAVLKLLTGGDTIAARFLHENEFEFRPQFKLWLRANHRPPVREQTVAFWRRMRLVPFDVTIPEAQRDKALPAKLIAEAAGILAWAVRGCLAWQREGLGEPTRVQAATAAYREENDVIADFFDARCALDPGAWTATAELYRAFTAWWETSHARHERPLNSAWFGRLLGERPDVATKRDGHARTKGWRGVRLLDGFATMTGSAEPVTHDHHDSNDDDDDLPF